MLDQASRFVPATSDLTHVPELVQEKPDKLANGKLNRVVWLYDRRIGSHFELRSSKEPMLVSTTSETTWLVTCAMIV